MKTAARTTICQQATPSRENLRTASARRRGRRGGRETRRVIFAIGTVVAAIAAVVAFATLVVFGGGDAGSPSPGSRVVEPGPAVNGSDQHLHNLAPKRDVAPGPAVNGSDQHLYNLSRQ